MIPVWRSINCFQYNIVIGSSILLLDHEQVIIIQINHAGFCKIDNSNTNVHACTDIGWCLYVSGCSSTQLTLLSLIDFVLLPNICSICLVSVDALNSLSLVVNSVKLPPSLENVFVLLLGTDLSDSLPVNIVYCRIVSFYELYCWETVSITWRHVSTCGSN